MEAPAFTNLSGTMADSFTIGKRGVKILQDTGSPVGVLASPGSLFISKDDIKLYQVDNNSNWIPLLTANAITSGPSLTLSYANDRLVLNLSNNVVFPGSNGITLPIGDTEARDTNPSVGTTRFNTDISALEVFNGSCWANYSKQANTYFLQFNDSDLTVDANTGVKYLTVEHNLGEICPIVQLWDNNYSMAMPVSVTSITNNVVQMGVIPSSLIAAGTWNVRISI